MKRPTLDGAEDDGIRTVAPVFVTQLARLMRIATMHRLGNPVLEQARLEFQALSEQWFDGVDLLSLGVVGEHLYLNGEFVPLAGASYESALHLRRVFRRLRISGLTINDRFEPAELTAFIEAFQESIWTGRPSDALSSPRFSTQPAEATPKNDLQGRELIAQAYVHLATLVREAQWIFDRGGKVSIPQLRRAVHIFIDAALGNEAFLLALSRLPNPEGDVVLHSTAVTGLAVLMGLRLGLDRKQLSGLTLSAIFHELGAGARATTSGKISCGWLLGAQEQRGLATALKIGRRLRSAEAVERASVALELPLPVGGSAGVIPSMAARLLSLACTFDSLIAPAPPGVGVAADQALAQLQGHAHFDQAALTLFTSVVGVFPAGTLVQLSGGQVAVVLSTPSGGDRPTVKVIRDRGAPADYVVELSHGDVDLEVVRALEPGTFGANALNLLFA